MAERLSRSVQLDAKARHAWPKRDAFGWLEIEGLIGFVGLLRSRFSDQPHSWTDRPGGSSFDGQRQGAMLVWIYQRLLRGGPIEFEPLAGWT